MVSSPESIRKWACILEEAETYRMGFTSRAAAIEALEGQAGEVVGYEPGFPMKVAEQLFDVDRVLSHAEEISVADGMVLGRFGQGLFDDATDANIEELRRRLAAAFVNWTKENDLAVMEIVEREEVELPTDAKSSTA